MKVEIYGKSARIRCDACCRLEKAHNPLIIRGEETTRPEGRDRFFDLVIPPSVSTMTGKPDNRYKGCAREDQPGVLVPMHLCPGCAIDIRKCVSFKIGKAILGPAGGEPSLCDAIQIDAIGDVMKHMKAGPLRDHLISVKNRGIFPTMGAA